MFKILAPPFLFMGLQIYIKFVKIKNLNSHPPHFHKLLSTFIIQLSVMIYTTISNIFFAHKWNSDDCFSYIIHRSAAVVVVTSYNKLSLIYLNRCQPTFIANNWFLLSSTTLCNFYRSQKLEVILIIYAGPLPSSPSNKCELFRLNNQLN